MRSRLVRELLKTCRKSGPPPQVEHELQVEREFFQPERRRVVLAVVRNREHSRMSILSTQRSTSGPSSTSALKTAIRDVEHGGGLLVEGLCDGRVAGGPAEIPAMVVTRRWNWPDECW